MRERQCWELVSDSIRENRRRSTPINHNVKYVDKKILFSNKRNQF